MLPKKGTLLPPGDGAPGHGMRYAEVIAAALRTELGDTHRAVKSARRWTGASERAVKNWLAGTAGPRGDHLLAILHHSDIALQMVLAACRRLSELDLLLVAAGSGTDGRWRPPTAAPTTNKNPRQAGSETVSMEAGADASRHDPDHDPDDPDDPERDPRTRQLWFLNELAAGRRASARSIEGQFGVSQKTAKRDVAMLKAQGLVQFAGARRTGLYRLTSKRT